MRTCEKCGGFRATEPGGEMIGGRICFCGSGDSALELMGKERLTQPVPQVFHLHTNEEYASLENRLATAIERERVLRNVVERTLELAPYLLDDETGHFSKLCKDALAATGKEGAK